jgi:hypothetical protein
VKKKDDLMSCVLTDKYIMVLEVTQQDSLLQTSIIICHPDSNYFQISVNDVFADLNNWFKADKFTSSFDKTKFMKFATNNKTKQVE